MHQISKYDVALSLNATYYFLCRFQKKATKKYVTNLSFFIKAPETAAYNISRYQS